MTTPPPRPSLATCSALMTVTLWMLWRRLRPDAKPHGDAQYSWNAHVGKAVDLGVSADALAALAERGEPCFASRDEQVLYRFSTEILGDHFVSDETFALALEEFGEAGLLDLIGSLGNFSMPAMLLNAFQVDLLQVEPPFPDLRGYARIPDTDGAEGQ